MSENTIQFSKIDDILIDRLGRQIYCCGSLVKMTPLTFDLFIYLFDNANRVCSYDELLETIWKYDCCNGDAHVVRLAISRLRKSFQNCPDCHGISLYVRTVRSIGYCLNTFTITTQTLR